MTTARSTAVTFALALAACGASSKPPPAAPAPSPAAPDATARFHYDAATGRCVDGGGHAGLNPVDATALFPKPVTGGVTFPKVNAECVDFADFDFSKYMGLGYSTLSKWNLRGARFTRAKFLFAKMEGVDLAGADMSELNWGYTTIEGTGDEHTKRPEGCPAKEKPEEIFCMR